MERVWGDQDPIFGLDRNVLVQTHVKIIHPYTEDVGI